MAISESTAVSTREDGPVLSLINKRLRALKKKLNRISQMEESIALGRPINKEQEDVLKSKPALLASIDELEKLRAPLLSALSEELSLALSHPQPRSDTPSPLDNRHSLLEDLLNLLYFSSLFDVKSQGEFTATMLTRTHERGCCLTYDYVTDDATDLLGERDLDLISTLGGLLISRPADSGLSHKNALRCCVEHAKLWLSNSDRPIDPNSNVSYAGLREKLNKIMASDYFTTTPEMKGTVEMAAAAAGNYAQFQVPVHGVPNSLPVQVEGSAVGHFQEEEEDAAENFQGHETGDNQSSAAEEFEKGERETENENHAEAISGDLEPAPQPVEVDHNQREFEPKEQHNNSRRNYQNHRGGRGGGRRGYPNGRGGRIGSRGGGSYQNGRGLYYDQPGTYYPRNYYNNRGRGGRGGGHPYNNHGAAVQGGHAPAADVGVTS